MDESKPAAAAADDSIAGQLAAESEVRELELKRERDARRTMRRQARERRRKDLVKELGLMESDPRKLVLLPRRCIWRDEDGIGNGLVDVQDRQRREDERGGTATLKRRSFIPVTKLSGLVGYWLGLYYAQTRTFQKSTASKLGSGSGSAESMAAPLLPDVVIRDRMKASKGNGKVVEQYLDILVRSIVQFKYVPRVYLFGLLCGLYPEDGWSYASSAGLVFVSALRQILRDAPSFDVGAISKANTVWVADMVAESCVRVLFADDTWWSMKPWMDDCKNARVQSMWYAEESRRTLNADVHATFSLVGNIEPKDRRALPPELKNAGFNASVSDLDKLLCVLLTTWIEQRRITMEQLDAVESRRLEKESQELEMKRAALRQAQERPFSKLEVRHLKLGVRRHGVGQWIDMLRDSRLSFVHRTPGRLEHEWNIIVHRRERREQRRWDWRRWPWNPEWEWGALQVVPKNMQEEKEVGDNDEEEGQYREDWGVWDDMDITDDENDQELVRSSSDNTATDDSDEDRQYYAKKEKGDNNSDNSNSGSTNTQPTSSIGSLSIGKVLQKVAISSGSVNSSLDTAYEAEAEDDESSDTFLTVPPSSSSSLSSLSGTKGLNGQSRHVQSQPLLPSLQGSGRPGMMARSQSALHLGHYQFGDHTAHALSKTLGNLNGNQPPPTALFEHPGTEKYQSKMSIPHRKRTNLDPGSRAIDTLVLRDNGMTSSGFQSLSVTLMGNSNITSLDLRRNKLGTRGIVALSRVLKSFTCALKYLDLDSTGMDDRGFVALVTALSQRAARSRLPPAVALSAAKSGEEEEAERQEDTIDIKKKKKKKSADDAGSRIESLPSCLVEVHLGHNAISDVSYAALDEMIDSLPQLTHLDLSWNRLKERSALVLSQRIADARCPLTVLNMQFNRIGNLGACALLHPLCSLPTPRLELLDVSFNGILLSGDVLTEVVEVISRARQLKSLQMNGNELSEEDFQTIRFALAESSQRKTGSLVVGLESSAVAIVNIGN